MLEVLERRRLDDGAPVSDSVTTLDATTFERALASYGLTRDDATAPELVARAGETVILHESLAPRVLHTEDAAQFKAWIGLDNETIERYPVNGQPDVPVVAWTRGRDASLEQLTDAEWQNVQLAAKAFLFGHSELVA